LCLEPASQKFWDAKNRKKQNHEVVERADGKVRSESPRRPKKVREGESSARLQPEKFRKGEGGIRHHGVGNSREQDGKQEKLEQESH